jgi:hypothetical protein
MSDVDKVGVKTLPLTITTISLTCKRKGKKRKGKKRKGQLSRVIKYSLEHKAKCSLKTNEHSR